MSRDFWRAEWAHATSQKQLGNHGLHFIGLFFPSVALMILGLPPGVAWPLLPAAAVVKELAECYWKTIAGRRIWLLDSWFDLTSLIAGGLAPWLIRGWLV